MSGLASKVGKKQRMEDLVKDIERIERTVNEALRLMASDALSIYENQKVIVEGMEALDVTLASVIRVLTEKNLLTLQEVEQMKERVLKDREELQEKLDQSRNELEQRLSRDAAFSTQEVKDMAQIALDTGADADLIAMKVKAEKAKNEGYDSRAFILGGD